jgi:hypothetical protein
LWATSTPSSVIEHEVDVAELSPTAVRVANRTLLGLIVNAQVPGTMDSRAADRNLTMRR